MRVGQSMVVIAMLAAALAPPASARMRATPWVPASARLPVIAPWKAALAASAGGDGRTATGDTARPAGELATALTLAHGPCASDPSCLIPDDPGFRFSWGLQNDTGTFAIPGTDPTPGADIDAPRAWSYAQGSPAIKIAIVDTGIDAQHEDLAGKVVDTIIVAGTDGVDRVGHGTSVAGVAGAVPDNGKGITGAGYRSSLISVKVAGSTTAGGDPTIDCDAAAQGIVAAANAGAQVINVSADTATPCAALESATNYAAGKNSLVIAAAGNERSSVPHYPAAYPNALSVAATDNSDRPATFTNANAAWIDLAAPGVAIATTLPDYPNASGAENYGSVSGTSYAAAYVSGIAALLWPITPDTNGDGFTNDEVARRLLAGADRIAGTGIAWRFGRLNACHSVAPVPSRCDEPAAMLVPSGTGAHQPATHRPTPTRRPRLGARQARSYLAGALSHSFPHSWRDRLGARRISCAPRARGVFSCRSSWRGHRATYSITVALSPVVLSGKPSWLHAPLRLKICTTRCRVAAGV